MTLLPRRPRGWLHALATYDCFPRLSARVRTFVYHPLGVLTLAAVAALLCGLFLHAQGFVLCGGVVAVLALGIAWPWLSLRGVSGTVSFDRARTSEGGPAEVLLTLSNRLPWAAWGLAVRGGFGPADEAVAGLASAPRRRVARCRWAFAPTCRGVYPLAPPRLTTGFPFGLYESGRALAVEASLVVWPRTFPVGPVPPVSGERLVEGHVSRSKVGSSGDVLGVRPYRRGDSPRRIHWGQSARHDRLIVCELQSNSRSVIQLVLDADPRAHAGEGPGSSREWAIRVAASLARGWLEDGAQVGLAWGEHEVAPASGQSQIHKVLDALAALPDGVGRPLGDVLACPRCRRFRDGLQVIVTTDRANSRLACGACEAEGRRWVVLETGGFAAAAAPPDAHGPTPWLLIRSPDDVPAQLRGGWREARHGS